MGLYYSVDYFCKKCNTKVGNDSEHCKILWWCPVCKKDLSENEIDEVCGQCGGPVGQCSHTTGIFR